MGSLFGTDGVRGIANIELTPELAFDLGRAGSCVLASQSGGSKPRILVGKDTRISCDMLEAALIAGICSTGADVLTAGIIPTPAVAYLTRKYQASCGIVISASHNPVEDNGIKFFGFNGYKLPDETEDIIEEMVLKGTSAPSRPQGPEVGRVYAIEEAKRNYIDYLLGCIDLQDGMNGYTVVLDCANGASYEVAPQLWQQLEAKVISINNVPNGININDCCGSTHTESLKKAVVDNQADIGIAYDGDADRCIIVDELGNELDGDYQLVMCALEMQRQGKLDPPKVVATVMSNIGLDIALQKESIEVVSCKVGDRYVLEKMQETGGKIGGEQSGHIIFLDHATTGDGLLTSLKVAEVLKHTGKKLSELAGQMKKQPQILVNVRIENKEKVLALPYIKQVLKEAEEKLGKQGKLVVRPSGTEPLVRIMAQGPDQNLLEEVISNIRKAVESV
jgi:phosphoglucosamine mutase